MISFAIGLLCGSLATLLAIVIVAVIKSRGGAA